MEVREFTFKGKSLVDPGPSMSVEEVKGLHASMVPELTTAGVKELPDGPNGEKRFEFVENVGRKG